MKTCLTLLCSLILTAGLAAPALAVGPYHGQAHGQTHHHAKPQPRHAAPRQADANCRPSRARGTHSRSSDVPMRGETVLPRGTIYCHRPGFLHRHFHQR